MPTLTIHASFEHPLAIWGGIGTAIGLLVRAAADRGVPVAVLTPIAAEVPQLPSPTRDIRTTGFTTATAGDLYSSPQRIELSRIVAIEMGALVRREARQQRVNLIVHNEELLPLVLDLRSIEGIDVQYFAHGLSTEEHPGETAIIDLQHEIVRKVHRILVTSKSQAKLMLAAYGRLPEVAPLPLELLLAETHATAPQVDGPELIVAAGRMVPQKGFDLLVEAFSLLPSPPRCIVVAGHGDSDYAWRCRRAAERRAVNIEWRPWGGREDLKALVVGASALVMPSRFEPFGMLAAESIAWGTPVIGSDVGGLGTILRATRQTVIPMSNGAPEVATLAEEISGHTPARVAEVDRRRLGMWSTRSSLAALELNNESPASGENP